MKITLKDARISAGYTQKTLAYKLGISESTVVRWENGKSPIKIQDLLKLSDIYNRSVEDFLL